MGKTPTLPRIRYMSWFDLAHAPVATTARAAATGYPRLRATQKKKNVRQRLGGDSQNTCANNQHLPLTSKKGVDIWTFVYQ